LLITATRLSTTVGRNGVSRGEEGQRGTTRDDEGCVVDEVEEEEEEEEEEERVKVCIVL